MDHRSSMPLCLAYKAAQLAAPDKADDFLISLRHATVIDCRPTTRFDEILRVVRKSGIDEKQFTLNYENGNADAALNIDLALGRKLGIRSLPAYLLRYGNNALLLQSFDYQSLVETINQVTLIG